MGTLAKFLVVTYWLDAQCGRGAHTSHCKLGQVFLLVSQEQGLKALECASVVLFIHVVLVCTDLKRKAGLGQAVGTGGLF